MKKISFLTLAEGSHSETHGAGVMKSGGLE